MCQGGRKRRSEEGGGENGEGRLHRYLQERRKVGEDKRLVGWLVNYDAELNRESVCLDTLVLHGTGGGRLLPQRRRR